MIHPMHNLKLIGGVTIRPNMHFAMIACGLFILISGATITYSNIDRGVKPIEFYKKRLLRVLIPFYIAYIIYFIIKVITLKNIHIYGGVPKWNIIWTICGMDEYLNAVGFKTFSLGIGEWFLGCIVLCYLVYPFLYKAHKKNPIITFIVMTSYYIVLNLNYTRLGFVIPSHMNFLSQVYNFYLGIALACVAYTIPDNGVWTKISSSKWLLILTIPTFLFFYFYKPIINIPDNFKTTIVVLSIAISFYLLEEKIASNKVVCKITNYFNNISYEFFLVHHFVIYQIDYMVNYRRVSGVETLIIIIVDFALTIIIAIVVKRISKSLLTATLKIGAINK